MDYLRPQKNKSKSCTKSKSEGKDLTWKATVGRVQIFLKTSYIFVLSHSALEMFFSSSAYTFLLSLWNPWFWKVQLQIYKKPFHIFEAHYFKFASKPPSKHWPTWNSDRRNIQPHLTFQETTKRRCVYRRHMNKIHTIQKWFLFQQCKISASFRGKKKDWSVNISDSRV